MPFQAVLQILHSWSSSRNPLAIHAFLNIANTWPFQVLRCSQLFPSLNIIKRSCKKNYSSFDSDTKYILPITFACHLECHDLALAFRNTYSVWHKVMWTTTVLFLSNVLCMWRKCEKYHELYSSGPNIPQQSISLFSGYDQVIVI